MSFFSRFFGSQTNNNDPTRDWPAATGASPQMDVERRALKSFGGRVTLGDRLEAARILGRPDTFEASGAWTILRYERWGLVLEFEEQQLFSVEFQIREPESGPSGRVDAPPRADTGPGWSDQRRSVPHLPCLPHSPREHVHHHTGQRRRDHDRWPRRVRTYVDVNQAGKPASMTSRASCSR